MNKINTILFDFDRTLRFPLLSWEDFTFQFFESMGITLDQQKRTEIKRWVYYYFQSPEFSASRDAMEEDDFWTSFYRQYTRQIITDEVSVSEIAPVLQDKVLNECFPNYRDHVPEDTHRTLNLLRDQGYQLGIITNRSHAIDEELDQLQLAEFFPNVTVSGLVGSMKPDPDIFHHALSQMNANPEQSVYIGDNFYADVLGARNIGMQPILIDPDRIFPEADCPVIDSLSELPAVLESFSAGN